LSGTLGVLLACVAAGGTPVQGLARAVARGLSEPDARRDLDGIDTAAKALILARTAGWDAELRGIEREPVGGIDWSTVPTHEVGAELERLGPDLAASLSGDVRYLASVSPSALHVGIGRAPAELAALDPANSAVRIETTGFRAFPLVLSGRGGGSAAAAEAVLADVVAAAGRDGA
jgi:homoserine dehydrogenase